MKRDFEIVRQILMAAESDGNRSQLGRVFGVKTVAQHVEWMIEANLLRGQVHKTIVGEPVAYEICQPTWQGLEFWAVARDEERWEKVMAACGDSSFGVVSAMLHELALRKTKARI